jgi:hypothetical protein
MRLNGRPERLRSSSYGGAGFARSDEPQSYAEMTRFDQPVSDPSKVAAPGWGLGALPLSIRWQATPAPLWRGFLLGERALPAANPPRDRLRDRHS